MLQLLYVSSAPSGQSPDVAAILARSVANNRRDRITGLLYTDGKRFLQVLEGPQDTVEQTFARIAADPRHRAVVVLTRRTIAAREFGEWAMAQRPIGGGDAFSARIAELCRGADPNVAATFQGLVEVRRAA